MKAVRVLLPLMQRHKLSQMNCMQSCHRALTPSASIGHASLENVDLNVGEKPFRPLVKLDVQELQVELLEQLDVDTGFPGHDLRFSFSDPLLVYLGLFFEHRLHK